MMIFGESHIPFFFFLAGFFLQLLATFLLLGIGLVTIRRLLPAGDAFLLGRLDVRIARVREVQFHGFGCRSQRRLAHVLGLVESPKVRGLDIGAQALGLRALAERLGEGQE